MMSHFKYAFLIFGSGGRTEIFEVKHMESKAIIFIDGTNLLVQLSRQMGVNFRADNPPPSAIALTKLGIDSILFWAQSWHVTRRSWYGSYKGNEETHSRLRELLRRYGYDPSLFKQTGGREKGVDIALTKDMLVHAFNRNFDIIILIAGDEDYVQLVQEAKRYGSSIQVSFFRDGLSPNLKVSADNFIALEQHIDSSQLQKYKEKILDEIKQNQQIITTNSK